MLARCHPEQAGSPGHAVDFQGFLTVLFPHTCTSSPDSFLLPCELLQRPKAFKCVAGLLGVYFKHIQILWKGFIYLDGQDTFMIVLLTGLGCFPPLKLLFLIIFELSTQRP